MGNILSKCLGKDRTRTSMTPIEMVSSPIITPEADKIAYSPPNQVVPLATAEMKPPDTTDTGTMIKYDQAINISRQQANIYYGLADSGNAQQTSSSPNEEPPEEGEEEISERMVNKAIRSSMLWAEAIKLLPQQKGATGRDEESPAKHPVQSLLKEIKDLQNEDVFIADSIFGKLDKYAVIGDIAIQHNPRVVALVWAGFRLLLKIEKKYTDNLTKIIASLGYLASLICCGAIYENLYLGTEQKQDSMEILAKRLIDQYVLILEYLHCVKGHLGEKTHTRIIQSLFSDLPDKLREIKEAERNTKEMAELVEKEVANLARFTHGKLQVHLQIKLKNIREELGSIEAIVNDCHAKIRQIWRVLEEREITKIRDWISTSQFGEIHDEHKSQRNPDTCHWLGKNDRFSAWINYESSSKLLWLRGAPGTGKTILASYVIEQIRAKARAGSCLAFFYCITATKDHSEPASILRAILRQVCIAYSYNGLPHALVRVKKQKEQESSGPLTIYEAQSLIVELSHHLPGLWIVIDALDECDKSSRPQLFDALKTIERDGFGVRIFVTGRSEGDIVRSMDVPGHENYCIEASDNTTDIEQYIRTEIKKLYGSTTGGEATEKLSAREESLVLALKNEAKGMFLSTSLRIQALKRETTIEGVEEATRTLPIELNEIYDNIFKRIGSQGPTDSKSTSNIIQWLAYTIDDPSTETLLGVLQMNHPAEHSIFGQDRPTSLMINYILNVCYGLVLHDQALGQIRFFHATVREYLNQPSKGYLQGGQRWIAELCLAAIMRCTSHCQNIQSLDSSRTTYSSRTSFDNYATRNWGHHLRESGYLSSYTSFLRPRSESYHAWALHIGSVIPILKGPGGNAISILWVACYYRLFTVFEMHLRTLKPSDTNIDGCTVLHHSADMGYLEFVKALLSSEDLGIDVNLTDNAGLTPLMMAARSGHATVVQELLNMGGQKIDVNMADYDTRRTALMNASIAGSGDIIDMLLSINSCDISLKANDGFSALHHAAFEGHLSLLERFTQDSALNINSKTKSGDTALSLAVSQGYTSVVRRLLRFPGIDPNCINECMETPLVIASRLAHQAVVEVLVADERTNVNYSRGSDSLLIQACEGDKKWLVELLLKGKDINVNYRGVNGWTALANAAARGSLNALAILLEYPGLEINLRDTSGFTPLHRATAKGYIECVRLLLCRGAELSAANESGETALCIAAQAGHTELLRTILLHASGVRGASKYGLTHLDKDDQNSLSESLGPRVASAADFVNHTDSGGRTALMFAALKGNSGIVELLLEKEGINVNIASNKGNTALICAGIDGHLGIVELLLKQEGVNVNIASKIGVTALMDAASKGHSDIVSLLLEHEGIDVDIAGEVGVTALMNAASKGHSDILKRLLDHEGINVNIAGKGGVTALMNGAITGHSNIVELLLKHEGIDVNIASKNGVTALMNAAIKGHLDIVELLLEHEGIDVNIASKIGVTALMDAASKGHSDIVSLLLEHEGIDVNTASKIGVTALMNAASKGHSDIVELLIKQEGIDVNIRNKKGETAFDIAKRKGHEKVMPLLKPADGTEET